jgi:hypothetical protein
MILRMELDLVQVWGVGRATLVPVLISRGDDLSHIPKNLA